MSARILPLCLLLTGASFWGGEVDAEAVDHVQKTLDKLQLEEENTELKVDLETAMVELESLAGELVAMRVERDAALAVVADLETKVKTLRSQRDEAFTRLLNVKQHNNILARKVKELQAQEEEVAAQLAAAVKQADDAESKTQDVAARLDQETKAGAAFRQKAAQEHDLLVDQRTWFQWVAFRGEARLAICNGSEECRAAVGKELDAKVRGDALACMGSGQAAPVLWNTADPAVPGSKRFVRLTQLPGLFRSPWTVEVCDRSLPEADDTVAFGG